MLANICLEFSYPHYPHKTLFFNTHFYVDFFIYIIPVVPKLPARFLGIFPPIFWLP